MTVTLETLRADFEAIATEFEQAGTIAGPVVLKVLSYQTNTPEFYIDVLLRYVGHIHEDFRDLARRLINSAHVYVIARDHGLNAAMLYKLSDGAIDPRKDDGE